MKVRKQAMTPKRVRAWALEVTDGSSVFVTDGIFKDSPPVLFRTRRAARTFTRYWGTITCRAVRVTILIPARAKKVRK